MPVGRRFVNTRPTGIFLPVRRVFCKKRPTGEAKQEQNRNLSKSIITYITWNNGVKTTFGGVGESGTFLSL